MQKAGFRIVACGFLVGLVGSLVACSAGISPREQALEATVAVLQTQAAKPSATFTSTPLTTTPAPEALTTRIDEYMRTYRGFSGVIFIAQKGKVLINQGYGLADRENDVPNTPQTKFEIGSISKSFTAMAIMILQEQGKLLAQDPLCNYLKDCPAAWKSITLHHLLTHTSGIPNYTELHLEDKINICREYEPEEVITYFKDLPLDFAPGDEWRYSNSGYFLLGMVIEKVSSKSYEVFIQDNILQPLGMSESGYDHSSAIVENRASGYIHNSRMTPVNAPCWDVSLKYAAGGLYSTVGDLYKWDQALYTDQLVSKETLNTIFTSTVPMSPDEGAYGYGWLVSQQSGHRVIEHSGGTFGFLTNLARYPDDQVTVMVLSNQEFGGAAPWGMGTELARIVLEEK